jgi:hypothetical protein
MGSVTERLSRPAKPFGWFGIMRRAITNKLGRIDR